VSLPSACRDAHLPEKKLQLTAMMNRITRTAAALCGGAAAALALGLGVAGADQPPGGATAPSPSVAPTAGGGAISVRPAGGGGACIVGLNCGCIPHRTCPTPHPRPGTAGANQHNAPAPQNP
jgi:hypothetical protein